MLHDVSFVGWCVGYMSVFYVVSEDLPTVAMFVDISRAYAFKRMLVKLGIQAEVIQTEVIQTERME